VCFGVFEVVHFRKLFFYSDWNSGCVKANKELKKIEKIKYKNILELWSSLLESPLPPPLGAKAYLQKKKGDCGLVSMWGRLLGTFHRLRKLLLSL